MQNNEEQIEFWNGEAGSTWVQQQQTMDATLQPISEALLAKANGQPGELALDVGCGCGDTSLALGSAGLTVTGVDVSAPMLKHAEVRVGSEAVNFVEADAAAHQFAQPFDLLLSRFGVMFFGDPTGAFTNLHQHTKPSGRLCFVCWQAPQLNAWVSLPMLAAKDMLPDTPQMDPSAPGPFAFADAVNTNHMLQSAGWKDVQVEDVRWQMKMGENAEEATHFATQIGPLSRALRELPQSQHAAVMDKVLTALAPHQSQSGVKLDAASWIVTARA